MESTSFACIGSTKSGRRAEAAECNFTSLERTVRYRLGFNRKSQRRDRRCRDRSNDSRVPDFGGRNCRGILGRSGLKESKQGTGKATVFRNGSRHEPVVRRRTPKLPLEPQEFSSCGETSTKMKLAQLRSTKANNSSNPGFG